MYGWARARQFVAFFDDPTLPACEHLMRLMAPCSLHGFPLWPSEKTPKAPPCELSGLVDHSLTEGTTPPDALQTLKEQVV